ncbi:MAG: hypothetical protein M1308_08865, partial [Actinobacteria bacterium]|nr:hypothetical protein [Actinomycetota bacterium]
VMQVFRFISIPILRNVIQIFVVLQIISLMSFLFNYIYVMTGGGPGFSSTVLEYFVYVNEFKYQDLGKANAASLILIFITVILISLYLYIMRKQTRELKNEVEG